jgi:hypothetical protein
MLLNLFGVVLLCLAASVVLVTIDARRVERVNTERYRRHVAGSATCPHCAGTGRFSGSMRGDPVDPLAVRYGGFDTVRSGPCPRCQGTGYLPLEAAESAAVPARKVNGLAVTSLVLAILGLFTVVPGLIAAFPAYAARKRSWDSGDRGAGMAKAALVGGPLGAVFGLVMFVPIGLALYSQRWG